MLSASVVKKMGKASQRAEMSVGVEPEDWALANGAHWASNGTGRRASAIVPLSGHSEGVMASNSSPIVFTFSPSLFYTKK